MNTHRSLFPAARLLLGLGVLLLGQPCGGQVYERVFSFTEARIQELANAGDKGRAPSAGLVQGSDGNFFGTTSRGGATDRGTIFKLTPVGELTTLVEFTGNGASNKGQNPSGGLVQGGDGNFYGTTYFGGGSGRGTVFKVTPGGELTTLVEFTGSEGGNPSGALVQDSAGNFYGTTELGGAGDLGTVFRVTRGGVLTTLVEFTGDGANNKGKSPNDLVQGSDGNFYGTTAFGGPVVDAFGTSHGTVFKMTPGGMLTTLVEFTGVGGSNKGSTPYGGLVQGRDGNFYGTTSAGGTNTNRGTVFQMTPGGVLTTLTEFTGTDANNQGSGPSAGLVQGSDGNFYGTAGGGTNNLGVVFRVTPSGVRSALVDFSGNGANNKGKLPNDLVQGSDGNFYGMTSEGGANDLGTIFQMTPGGVLTTLVEFAGKGGSDKGKSPNGLVQGDDGSIYGTSVGGGPSDFGTVFKLTPGGGLSTLVGFTGNGASNKGKFPLGGLVQGRDGNFYGTTEQGGASEAGTVFKVTPGGVLTTLFEFAGNGTNNAGRSPSAALAQGIDGDFYGTTRFGGADDLGTVFKVTPAGVLTTLVEFTGNGPSDKGGAPVAGLVRDSDGNFYGTTSQGGANNLGTVFKLTPAGVLTTLVEFTGNGPSDKGGAPLGDLGRDSDGNFYGTTLAGGADNFGTVFRMTPDGALTTLVEFTSSEQSTKGRNPSAGLVQGIDGNFYGTSGLGGASDRGTLFQIITDGTQAGTTLTPLVQFDSPDGFPGAAMLKAADGNLYGTVDGPDGAIYRLIFPGAPTIAFAKVTLQAGMSAVVEGQVNARGASTDAALEYGTDGVDFPNTVPLAVGLNGFQTKLVGTTLSDLHPATTYFFRFCAVSGAGTTVTPVQSFATLAEPVVAAGPASEITAGSARFNGTINARNFASTVVFEWGVDGNSFPNIAPATPGTVTGDTPVAVSAAVAGLPSGGTVFYRLRATNAAGTVISGVRSFSTVSVTTSNPLPTEVGVTEATFRATIDTFGQTAQVKFKYWADAAPAVIFETAAQAVMSNGPTEVRARVPGLAENVAYSYRVSVALAGTETDGGAVMFTTQTNQAPIAVADLVFYSGQVVIDPLANDADANGDVLLLAPTLVVAPNASRGVASVTNDRRFISYNPQFNVLDDDALTYRVLDPLGASAEAQVRLIAFSKRAGLYGGPMVFGSGDTERRGAVAVQMGGGGAITTSFLNWSTESFVLKGVFDQRGRFTRTLNSPGGAVLTITMQLDADEPVIHGSFEERMGDTVTASVPDFTLTRNAGTGGLAESGLRTGFLNPPASQAAGMSDGFLRMTVGKDKRRGARFAGRLPDGEPFLAGGMAQGRSYVLARKLEQGGLFTGLVRAIDASANEGGMMGNLLWQKRASGRAKFHRSGVNTLLALSGVAYPVVPRGAVPPIGLGSTSPNARLRLSGGDLAGSYRDLLLNVVPGTVQVIGPDLSQSGADLPLVRLMVKVDGPAAAFRGRFMHPATGKLVPFEGAFRMSFDGEPAQGRGVFRGPSAAGAVRIEVE